MKTKSQSNTRREAQNSSVRSLHMAQACAGKIGHTAKSRREITALIMKVAKTFNAESITFAAR